jgi:hypothetical protein
MARKKIAKTEYVVTAIGYAVGGQLDKARIQAERAGTLRQDIWNKFGSLKAWGLKADYLYKDFQKTNPPEKYGLDFKQWQRTFSTVIDDIHACQDSAISVVAKKICKLFKSPEMVKDAKGKPTKEQVNPEEPNLRKELLDSLKTLSWMDYPLLHRWMRKAYHRGHTWVNNQICVGIGNGATLKRKSKNVVTVTFCGDKVGNRYEKISLDFKVGRITPKGNMRIIFTETGRCELHFPRVVIREAPSSEDSVALDKGFTEGFYGSDGVAYADGISVVMRRAVFKRHVRGKGRNKLYSIANNKNKPHIHQCNLGKKRWSLFEQKKKRRLTTMVRTGVNQVFDQYGKVITEDLSSVIKGKKQAKKRNRNLSEWCKGILQKSLDEISLRRSSTVLVVNAAYTSQVDSRNGTLLGFRNGDSFFTFDGEVIQADYNAAQNIKYRDNDPLIHRYMRWNDVHSVLMQRTASFLLEMDLTIEDALSQGWLDSKHIRSANGKKGKAKSNGLVA